jgi:ribosomal protein L24
MRWMRTRGDRVKIITGKYAGHFGTVESNVYQRTMDYPDEFSNGYHVMLDSKVLVTVQWDQVDAVAPQC